DEEEVVRPADVARVLHHQGEQIVEQLVVERVEEEVGLDDRLRLSNVSVDEGVERGAELILAELGQLGQVVDRRQRRRLVQVERALGDVHGQIAHALEVHHDLERGGDEAQI